MKYIKLRKKNNRIYFYFNKIIIGYSYKESDGFYVFIFDENIKSFFESYILREMSDILDYLNYEWNNKINEYFKENTPFDNDKISLNDWLNN